MKEIWNIDPGNFPLGMRAEKSSGEEEVKKSILRKRQTKEELTKEELEYLAKEREENEEDKVATYRRQPVAKTAPEKKFQLKGYNPYA